MCIPRLNDLHPYILTVLLLALIALMISLAGCTVSKADSDGIRECTILARGTAQNVYLCKIKGWDCFVTSSGGIDCK